MTRESIDLATAILTSLGGGSLIVLSISSWLGKVWAERVLAGEKHKFTSELEQIRAELQQARDRLGAELEKTVHVHRAQFGVEFRALRIVWTRLVRLRSCLGALYQRFQIVSENEDETVRRKRRIGEYCDALARYFWAVHNFSPFYSKQICEQLMSCLDIAQREEINARTFQENFRQESMAEGRQNFERLSEAVDKVSDMIRLRMESLSVR